uniref:probable E3 ubiquitin-protein ligase RNF217 n=1 Tax=Erigeron canadensis TaxID=72917 RepID=UPI001CB8F7B2|nr:probable E3 ubiquitin-protein ligase RNF217 [Erigeron canadensis]
MGNAVAKPQQNPHQDPQNQQQEEENQDATFTCEICIEPVSLPNIKFNNNNLCAHPFCADCIIKYIQVKLDENVSDIKCPAMTCQHSLEPLSCRPKLTPQAFEKWCDVLCESSVLRVKDRVYCPNIDCRELILNECGDTNLRRCVCAYCKKPYCLRCKAPWHDDNSACVKDENDIAFELLLKRKRWQRCAVCKRCIQRSYGCNQVECKCGNKFCYLCGKQNCTCGFILSDRLFYFTLFVVIGVPLILIFSFVRE